MLIASIGLNVFQYQRNKRLFEKPASAKITKRESISESTSNSEVTPVKMAQENTATVSKKDKPNENDLENQLNAIEEELDIANEQLYDELIKQEAFRNAVNQFQKNMLSNPAFKQSIKDSLIQGIDRDYSLLYERLDLSPDELHAFKSIVADWRMANLERADLINAASSAEEKQEAYRQRQEARDKYNNEFIDLMGEEKFRIYDDFKNRNSERHMLNDFMETLSPENRINKNQTENLIDAMYEARKSFEIEMGFDDIIDFPSDIDEETVAHQMEMERQVYEKYAEIGSAIMPQAQTDQYKDYLNQELDRTEARLKMRLFTRNDEQ